MAILELELGAPAAGGGFVARDPEGRVVFVRHGITGERVRCVVTEEHATWARADVVEVREPSPDRVAPPCPYAGAGACGGCDYQHVSMSAQRVIKQTLLAEQLSAVAGLDIAVEVESVDPGGSGLGTRTRVRFGADEQGRLSMRKHGSHDLVAVSTCALGVGRITALPLADREWSPGSEIEAVCLSGANAPSVVVSTTKGGEARRRGARGTEVVLEGPGLAPSQRTEVDGAPFAVSAGVFWQVHERAPEVLVGAVLEGLSLSEGDRVADLYCGAGLFTRVAASAVGPAGSVVGVDSSREATADARRNLQAFGWARIVTSRVDRRSTQQAIARRTHLVMDPPRRGVDRGALRAICDAPSVRRLVSVSCDPSTFARDLRVLLDEGWKLHSTRAFDLFEMTEHLECVAVLER